MRRAKECQIVPGCITALIIVISFDANRLVVGRTLVLGALVIYAAKSANGKS